MGSVDGFGRGRPTISSNSTFRPVELITAIARKRADMTQRTAAERRNLAIKPISNKPTTQTSSATAEGMGLFRRLGKFNTSKMDAGVFACCTASVVDRSTG